MNREQPEVTKQVYPLTVGKLFLSIYMKNLLSCDFFFLKKIEISLDFLISIFEVSYSDIRIEGHIAIKFEIS
jgi:hypothetical protein